MAQAVFGGGGFSADGGSVFWRVAVVSTGAFFFGVFGCVGLGGRAKLSMHRLSGGAAPCRFLLEADMDFNGFWQWGLLLVQIAVLGGGKLGVGGAGGGGVFWRWFFSG